MSYMKRHRTICSVLEDISNAATSRGDTATVQLCEEAFTYARSMDKKLTEIRYKESQDGKGN